MCTFLYVNFFLAFSSPFCVLRTSSVLTLAWNRTPYGLIEPWKPIVNKLLADTYVSLFLYLTRIDQITEIKFTFGKHLLTRKLLGITSNSEGLVLCVFCHFLAEIYNID